MPGVRLEQERLRRGYCTWEYLWLPFKPGVTILPCSEENDDDTDLKRPQVAAEITGGILTNPPITWVFLFWRFDFDYGYCRRVKVFLGMPKFDGEIPLRFRVLDIGDHLYERSAQQFVEYGKLYWMMLKKQCRYYNGQTSRPPFRKVSKIYRRYLFLLQYTYHVINC